LNIFEIAWKFRFPQPTVFAHFCAGLQWILAPELAQVSLDLPLVEDMLISVDYLQAYNKQTWLRRALVTSPTKIREIALATVGQRNNPWWSAVRKYRLTASNFGYILGAIRRNR